MSDNDETCECGQPIEFDHSEPHCDDCRDCQDCESDAAADHAVGE